MSLQNLSVLAQLQPSKSLFAENDLKLVENPSMSIASTLITRPYSHVSCTKCMTNSYTWR